ncbi:MAG: hypothetical protein ACYCR4_10695 [Acidimicrobiales bacterium]
MARSITNSPRPEPGRARRAGWTPRALAALAAAAAAGLAAGPTVVGAPAARASVPSTRAAATKALAFSGHYSGNVAVLIDNSRVTISSVAGRGSGTLVGPSTVSGKGSASASAQCDPFGGTGSIAGPTARIDFLVTSSTSQGCSSGESGPVTVTFKGIAKATGGTGKARGVSGSLVFKGSLKLGNTSGSQKGDFTVTVSGHLALKG